METYSFWADAFTSFRLSSDLIKIVWLLAPVVFALVLTWLVRAIHRLLSPALLLSIEHPTFGPIHIYQAKAYLPLLAALKELPTKRAQVVDDNEILKNFISERDMRSSDDKNLP